jgi:hypothetical protein
MVVPGAKPEQRDSGPNDVGEMRTSSLWSGLRRGAAALRRAAVAACLSLLLVPAPADAQAVRGEATLSAEKGFARLVLKLSDDVDTEVTVAGSVLVIRFRKPVDIPVDRLSDAVPDYVGSARRDPDGGAIRMALARKVTVNSMTAGERVFIDLLPETWSGPPPGLPQDVVRQLAERAREAERLLRQQRLTAEVKKRPPVRVRASAQPTFVRFVFELPPGIGVSSSLEDKRLSLIFSAPLTFDLADAKLVAPPSIATIEQKLEANASMVSFGVIGEVDVHSFREDANYVVDIGFDQARKPPLAALPEAKPDSKPEAKPEAKPETRPDPPPVARSEEKKAAPKPAPKPEGTGEGRVEAPAPAAPMTVPAAAEAPATEAVPPPAMASAAAPEPVRGEETPRETVKAAAPPPAPAPPAAMAAKPAAEPAGERIKVVAQRSSDGLRLIFPFKNKVPVALFRRGEALWLVADTLQPLDTEAIRRDGGAVVGDVNLMRLDNGQALRIRLTRPQLAAISGDGSDVSVLIADALEAPPLALSAVRNLADPARAHVAVPIPDPGQVHRLGDPEAGDTLSVVTAPLPARGFIKRQAFVEFALLESIHGIVVLSDADDLSITTSPDKVVLMRPGGLTLSSGEYASKRTDAGPKPLFDPSDWRINRDAVFNKRLDELILEASKVQGEGRIAANLALSRFYLARNFYPEARAAASLAVLEAKPGSEDPAALILRAAASIMMNRPDAGLKDLANPAIGNGYDLEVWKGLALARQKKWPEAREKFKNAEFSIAALPEDLQRIVLAEAMRACLEVHDYAGASARNNDLGVVGVAPEMKPMVTVMRAQLAEALGRDKEALAGYDQVTGSTNREWASEATLQALALRQKRHEVSDEDALRQLETLAVTWRGDEIELQTLQQLSRIYARSNRYLDAFAAARLAARLQPNSEEARSIQQESSALFSQLFLGPKGDELPPIEALGLFYDYRELTPIGRRGDEMIRRLADRLAGIDLLDQAADLLQYQVDHRLEGAARAQVAARLATIYLMNRKPDRAMTVLRATRLADLSGELRQQRLLLEARAQSDIGRHDLALDIISNLTGREVLRLRSDINWAARRWRESAEQIELYYGDRWKDFQPLNAAEKGDVIRAAIGYALAEDTIGLGRFREKYGPKMSDGADRVAFDTASRPAAATSAEFAQIARMAASVDTLDGFLREMKTRFPDMAKGGPNASAGDTTGSLPRIRSVTARGG